MATGTLKVKIVGDDSDLKRKLSNSGAGIAGFAKKAAAAGLVVGAAVVGFAGKAIMAASDLNETMSQTEVVFGKSGKVITTQADRLAEKFGVVRQEFIAGANNLGLLAKGAGYTSKAAAKLGTEFATVAVDAASFYNVPVAQALEDIRSGLSGESEPLKKYGILLDEAAVKAEGMRLGLANANGELSITAKTQARASLITKGFNSASGDMARTQDSVANKVRKLQGKFANFTAEIGTHLMPVAEKFLEWADDRLPAAMEWTSRVVRTKIGPAVRWLGEEIKRTHKFIDQSISAWHDFRGEVRIAQLRMMDSTLAWSETILKAAEAATLFMPEFREKFKRAGFVVRTMRQRVNAEITKIKDEKEFRLAINTARFNKGLKAARKRFTDAIQAWKEKTITLPINVLIANISGDGPGGAGVRGGSALSTVKKNMGGIPGLSISSTYRTPAHNAAVGGSPTSYHIDKNNPAVDVVGPASSLDALYAKLKQVGGRELLWRTAGHYDHLHYADKGGTFKGPGLVAMGAGYETFTASGLRPAQKVSNAIGGCSCSDRPLVVTLDGRVVYESVKRHAGKDAKRNVSTGL